MSDDYESLDDELQSPEEAEEIEGFWALGIPFFFLVPLFVATGIVCDDYRLPFYILGIVLLFLSWGAARISNVYIFTACSIGFLSAIYYSIYDTIPSMGIACKVLWISDFIFIAFSYILIWYILVENKDFEARYTAFVSAGAALSCIVFLVLVSYR